MGWASGSGILRDVWETVRPHVAQAKRQQILTKLMEIFEAEDCDTTCELICDEWPEAEAAYDALHGPETDTSNK